MGQYHILINRDAAEHILPHTLGNGLKAWEQTAGGVPAALVFLLAARPGNAPGDVGHHPLAGHAAGVQMGSAFMACPEAAVSALHREALKNARPDDTVLSNVFSGRPARVLLNRLVRETGPIADMVPVFPTAGVHNQQLRVHAEAEGKTDFTPLWSGQAARLGRALPAGEVTTRLAREALEKFAGLTIVVNE